MKMKLKMWTGVLGIATLTLLAPQVSKAEDPCANAKQRALVMSGGGSKGAFETGAAYHLIVHRHCDFREFSGSSVGALNGAFLAQAEPSRDPDQSLTNLSTEAEGLVSLWQSIKSSKDIRKERRFAMLRWGLWGLESMNDLTPLRRLLNRNISMEKLAKGRPVRASVVSFWSGEYREIVARPQLKTLGAGTFLEYLYASSTLPVYAKLPRIPDGSASDDPKMWPQFSDSGVRHITPLSSYFKICTTSPAVENESSGTSDSCIPDASSSVPAHEAVEQLFVVVTSPFSRNSDELPITDASCCKPGRRQITDGRKILARTLALMDDSVYRSDLNFSLTANDIVRWRWQAYNRLLFAGPTENSVEAKQLFPAGRGFAIESYNRDTVDSDAPSRPYEIGLVAPKKESADPAHLLVISPLVIQEQLYCGCMAADDMMVTEFRLPSLALQCSQRFPRLEKARSKSVSSTDWDVNTCAPAHNATLEMIAGSPRAQQWVSREFASAVTGNVEPASTPSYGSQEP